MPTGDAPSVGGTAYVVPAPNAGMDGPGRVLLGVVAIVAATVLAGALAAGMLFGVDESVTRPFVLLAREPFAWVVVAALLVAVVGHSYID